MRGRCVKVSSTQGNTGAGRMEKRLSGQRNVSPTDRGGVCMSKVGPIWRFSVLCLLALEDAVPKPYFLLLLGDIQKR